MIGRAGSTGTTGIVHADMTSTQSRVKVKVTGLLNFRQLSKPCMLQAMTAAPLRGFLVNEVLFVFLIVFMQRAEQLIQRVILLNCLSLTVCLTSPHITYACEALPYSKAVILRLDNLIVRAVYRIFNVCSSCLLYTSPSPRDRQKSRMPSSA